METHIEVTVDRVLYKGTVNKDTERLQCMEIDIEATRFGDSYRGYNVWSFIKGTMYGESYRGYNV